MPKHSIRVQGVLNTSQNFVNRSPYATRRLTPYIPNLPSQKHPPLTTRGFAALQRVAFQKAGFEEAGQTSFWAPSAVPSSLGVSVVLGGRTIGGEEVHLSLQQGPKLGLWSPLGHYFVLGLQQRLALHSVQSLVVQSQDSLPVLT
jgi:hypothetical protein